MQFAEKKMDSIHQILQLSWVKYSIHPITMCQVLFRYPVSKIISLVTYFIDHNYDPRQVLSHFIDENMEGQEN